MVVVVVAMVVAMVVAGELFGTVMLGEIVGRSRVDLFVGAFRLARCFFDRLLRFLRLL